MINQVLLVRIRRLLLSACLVCLIGTASAIDVKDYGVEVGQTPGSIHWMGDDSVVFKALVEVTEDRLTQYPGKRIGKLATLDLKTGKVEWGEEFTGRLCVNGEQVAYGKDNGETRSPSENDRFWLVRGTLDKLTTQEVTREELQAFDFEINCKPASEVPLPEWAKKDDRLVKRLRPEHGLIEFKRIPVASVYPAVFFTAGGTAWKSVELSAFRDEKVSILFEYYPFNGAYLFTKEIPAPSRLGYEYKAWWLFPDGRVEVAVQAIKRSDDGRFLIPSIPTREGFLTAHGRKYRRSWPFGNLGDAGLYMFNREGKHKKLAAGAIGPDAVSPDGCKVAAGLDDRQDDENVPHFRLHVFNLCK